MPVVRQHVEAEARVLEYEIMYHGGRYELLYMKVVEENKSGWM